MLKYSFLNSKPLNVFTFWQADCKRDPENQIYGDEFIVCNADDYIDLAHYDHVTSYFETCRRSEDKFMVADIMTFIVDNKGITDQRYILTMEDLHRIFDGTPHIISQIEDQKYIILLKTEPIADLAAYAALKSRTVQRYPVLGKMEIGVTDYISGTDQPNAKFWDGYHTLDAHLNLLDVMEPLDEDSDSLGEMPESLHSLLIQHFAIRILRRHGNCTQAREIYKLEAQKNAPELESDKLNDIWRTALRFEKQSTEQTDYVPLEQQDPQWEPVIPFSTFEDFQRPSFPVEALPDHVRSYVEALAESTQTPVDMAATAALAILASCLQGKYLVSPKSGWSEPLNLYVLMVAEPAERKSAIIKPLLEPVDIFERDYNMQHKVDYEQSNIMKRKLKKWKDKIETMATNGYDTDEEMKRYLDEYAKFKEMTPLQMYCDDVTPEKLVSILAQNKGRTSVISAEGGIFCQLAGGMYSKVPNIEVILKAHCGDTIRCDRITRESEIVRNPALTMLLAAQPSILMGIMGNNTFRGRGLTARFLYTLPQTLVGSRKYMTAPISSSAKQQYFSLIRNLLIKATDSYDDNPEIITLDNDASKLLEDFHYQLEHKIPIEYSGFADWAGKLEGAVVRICGLLLIADMTGDYGRAPDTAELIVDAGVMQRAITIGQYFVSHVKVAYQMMGSDPLILNCKCLLNVILSRGYMEFSQREILRRCQSFGRVDIVKPILQELCNRHFLRLKEAEPYRGYGRPSSPVYQVNPALSTSDQTNR